MTPRRALVACLLPLAALCGATAARAEPAVAFACDADSVRIAVAGKPFATYVFRDRGILRPYLAHVRTLEGTQVTRRHPPREGHDATDHDAVHPGVWLAFGDLSGADFWRNKAKVEHAEFLQAPRADGDGGSFTVLNRYLDGDKLLCTEQCRIAIRVRPAGCLVIWDSRFRGPEAFYFGDQEELGLGVRVATPLAVHHGGAITNSDGLVNEEQVWGKQADWCDYAGTIDGRPCGLLIVPDPANFRRAWFHARDYGFVAANPFGRRAFTGGEPSRVTVEPGESLRLRFAVLVHAGPIDRQAAAADVRAQLDATR